MFDEGDSAYDTRDIWSSRALLRAIESYAQVERK